MRRFFTCFSFLVVLISLYHNGRKNRYFCKNSYEIVFGMIEEAGIDSMRKEVESMDIHDMADLICVRDAYKAMNKSLLGEEMVLGFHEGYLGTLGRIFRVIERNVAEKWKQDNNGAIRMLDAISLTPEERARLLLEEDKCRIGEKHSYRT